MPQEVKLPELGENVTSGTISKILVSVGDSVAKDQSIMEVETEKAVAEIPCPMAGTVAEIRVEEGQEVNTGDVILTLDGAGGGAAKSSQTEKKSEEKAEKPQKAEKPAKPAEQKPQPKQAPTEVRAQAPKPAQHAAVLASPSVRRRARELGVDISAVPTSDPKGRVTVEDVQRFAQGEGAAPAVEAGAEAGQDRWGPVLYETRNMVRRKTGEHMTDAWTRIPHVTHFDEADITDIEALRQKRGKKIEGEGGRLTVLAFVLKAVVAALQRFPRFNAGLDEENDQIVLKRYYHIGVAVDTEHGLLVPPVRDVDQKSITDLALELPDLAERARARKLSIEEMQGATFTVSNLGGLGGTAFTPIINPPEVAILGLSRTRVVPVYRDGDWIPRSMLPLSLSYDHRVIDGADAARFARWVAEALEQPWSMYL